MCEVPDHAHLALGMKVCPAIEQQTHHSRIVALLASRVQWSVTILQSVQDTNTHTYAQTNPSVNPTNQSITQPTHPHPLQTPTSPPPNQHDNNNNTSAQCSTTPHINDAEQGLGGVKRM